GDRLDIVPVDFVARALVKLHLKERPDHEIYHLSSGLASESFETLTHALARAMNRRPAHYLAGLGRPFKSVVEVLARRRGTAVGHAASLLKVFLPYLVWNTVFDNSRAVKEVGEAPVPFSRYCYPLLKFSRDGHFTYPYTDWPPDSKVQKPELRRTGAEAEESNLRHDSRPAIPTPKSKIV
ncbi:MAG: hypothetical protein HY650_05950, partial [Acidobacteria bacterium]|nr:hypothetical protein [Acidobacteriota bacterium]